MELTKTLMESLKDETLVECVGALILLALGIQCIFNRNKIQFDPLVAATTALIACILILNRPETDFWLATFLLITSIAAMAWIIQHDVEYARRWINGLIAAPFVLASAALLLNDFLYNLKGQEITVVLSLEKNSPDSPEVARKSSSWEKEISDEFEKKTGIKVKHVPVPGKDEDRVEKILEQLKVNALQGHTRYDVDVYSIDVIWPGILAQYSENLSKYFDETKFNPKVIQSNKVKVDGEKDKLVAVPWYSDAGLLFYRPSLLINNGFGNQNPITSITWDQLEEMAEKIQNKERETKGDKFWGFVWQGAAYEGLTCNALEWQVSHGVGPFREGTDNMNGNDPTIAALGRAKGWINNIKISPPTSLKSREGESFDHWYKGNAAFMRNWPYAYTASLAQDSIPKHDIDVTLLPKGPKVDDHHASTLGGWQLMVNAASYGKKKAAAIEFIKFLTNKDNQISLAKKTGRVPALVELYDDNDVLTALPFLKKKNVNNLFSGKTVTGSIQNNEELVTRSIERQEEIQAENQSRIRNYPAYSKFFYNRVHGMLNGDEEIQTGVPRMWRDMDALFGAR